MSSTNALKQGKPAVAVLLYPGCIFFEIALAAETLAEHFSILYFTPDGLPHQASNGAKVHSEGDLEALKSVSLRALLIPGGDPQSILLPAPRPREALQAQFQSGAVIAGICAGNLVLAACGLLGQRRGTHNYTAEHAPAEAVALTAPYWKGMTFVRADLVRDENLITAQPWAYRKYAAAIAEALGVMTSEQASALQNYENRCSYGE